MSKKDFIALADRIRERNKNVQRGFGATPFEKDQIELLADFCTTQNPRFKRDRWLNYIAGKCGAHGGKVK